MSFDVLVRGATVVGAGPQRRLDVGVADGLIAALGPELAGPATDEIDDERICSSASLSSSQP